MDDLAKHLLVAFVRESFRRHHGAIVAVRPFIKRFNWVLALHSSHSALTKQGLNYQFGGVIAVVFYGYMTGICENEAIWPCSAGYRGYMPPDRLIVVPNALSLVLI